MISQAGPTWNPAKIALSVDHTWLLYSAPILIETLMSDVLFSTILECQDYRKCRVRKQKPGRSAQVYDLNNTSVSPQLHQL
jgi:hypothetical protein